VALRMIRKTYPHLEIREDAQLMYLIEFDDLKVEPDPNNPARRIGKVSITESTKAAAQIQDQVEALSSLYGQSGPEISCTVDAEDLYLPVDQAIPCALVVNEALSNAFKHAFRGRSTGTIRISAWIEGTTIHISIGDDGVGIPPDVDISRTTSLGLKLIRSLMQQLRGTLAIESTGRGSVVNVEFPLGTGE
jgi:two-component sensor histidine kinase